MKRRRILALVMALAVAFAALSSISFTTLAADSTKVILDTNDKAAIAKAGFAAEEKNVKTTKYSAKWKVDDAADKTIKGFPTDFSKFDTINFTMKIESTAAATIMLYFGSENSAAEGIDYYSKTYDFKPGEWQTIALKYSDLKPNRTPLGWNQLSDLAFKTIGWSNKAAAGTIVYIENMYLSGSPITASAPSATAAPAATPAASTATGTEDAANKTKVFFYNNYNDKNAGIATGAGVAAKSNSITQGFDSGDNGYVKIDVTGEADDCYYEASLKSTKVNNLVVEVSVSTDSTAPSGNLQYKDTAATRAQGTLFSIGGAGEITFYNDASNKVAATLKKGTWVKLGFLINFEKKQYTAYVDGKAFGTFNTAETLNDLSIMRLYINKGAANVGKSLLLDNFAVYGGTDFRDVSKEYTSPTQGTQTGGKITEKIGTDVAMDHPSLLDLKGGVALMVDRPEAYSKGARTKVDPTNDAVVPVVIDDRTLVPVRFIAESFDAKVDWSEAESKVTVALDDKTIELVIGSNQMIVNGVAQTIDVPATTINDRTMLPLRALVESLGKNVLWDDRGLIIITNSDVKLDAQKDIKLSTMIIGELVTGITAANYAAAPSFTQAIIDEAVAADTGSWLSNNGNSGSAEKSANIMYYLTLAARSNPQAASSDGTLVKDAVIKQLRHLIAGGNEPFACVGCYWGHAVVASDLVLIKNSPVIYDELTADEKDRMDWLMRGLAIAGNWGYNDANNYSTGFDLMGNFGKGWNPNFRNTYLSIVISASMYFGADELDKIYTSFDYDTYIKKYTELGFTNILATWTVAGKDLMEKGGKCTLLGGIGLSHMEAGQPGGDGKGVKLPFLYNGKGPGEIQYLFRSLAEYTYAFEVRSDYGTPGTDDYTHILSGKKSPFEGQMGMMREFAGGDGGSGIAGTSTIRSRCTYGYDSYEILVSVYANMKLFGGWDSSTDDMAKLDNRIYVGNEDLIFKMQEGYYGFSSGKGSNEYEYSYLSRGHKYVKDMWRNFHCMLNEEVTTATNPGAPVVVDAPKTDPKDGTTTAPAGAYPGVLLPTAGGFDASSFYPVGKNMTSGSVEFDVVLGTTVTATEVDAVIMLDKKQTGMGWSNANMLMQFKDGTINVRNGDAYTSTKIQIGANYRYHFKVDFDVAAKKYTVAITPTYPTAGQTVTLTDNKFRTGSNAIDLVDSIVVVKSTEKSVLWVENFKVN